MQKNSLTKEEAAITVAITVLTFCEQPEVFEKLTAWMAATADHDLGDLNWLLAAGIFESPAILKEASSVLAFSALRGMAAADVIEAMADYARSKK